MEYLLHFLIFDLLKFYCYELPPSLFSSTSIWYYTIIFRLNLILSHALRTSLAMINVAHLYVSFFFLEMLQFQLYNNLPLVIIFLLSKLCVLNCALACSLMSCKPLHTVTNVPPARSRGGIGALSHEPANQLASRCLVVDDARHRSGEIHSYERGNELGSEEFTTCRACWLKKGRMIPGYHFFPGTEVLSILKLGEGSLSRSNHWSKFDVFVRCLFCWQIRFLHSVISDFNNGDNYTPLLDLSSGISRSVSKYLISDFQFMHSVAFAAFIIQLSSFGVLSIWRRQMDGYCLREFNTASNFFFHSTNTLLSRL